MNIERYDVDLDQYISLLSLLVPACSQFVNIFASTDSNPVEMHRFSLQSASQFAIDGLQVGLETIEPGIPEPATSMMMIAGFGAVGISLRRRRAGLARQRITV